jgi:hypothetical protein
MEQASVLPITQNLIELLKRALFALEHSDDMTMSSDHVEEIQRLSADMLLLLGGTSFQSPQMQTMAEEWGLPLVESDPLASSPSDASPTAQPETNLANAPATSAASVLAMDPIEYVASAGLMSQRRAGLNLVQRIRQMVSAHNLPAN